ncbi:ABC transporter permease [Pseudahrensia aquimaris]|uniref:ABC transporter permease n=1 Tax=Pseudahrensia aquimaris TaxID=744461 RepID=A0ABW3F959_9HYPH
MLKYILYRTMVMIPTLVLASIVIFTIIQLPPGDYVETYIGELIASGESVDLQRVEYLREEYGLNQPMWQRYLLWITNFVQGDFGYSFEYQRPVSEVIGNRMFLTILVSFFTIILTWAIAFPIGIYSATHQYSWGDYGLTFVGLLGLATPNFLLALLMMYLAQSIFGISIGGLMDDEFVGQPMSWDKFISVLQHLIVPTIVIGTAGTAAMIRRIRANLLDELQKQYVTTARAKGVPPFRALVKYPLRMSMNFFVADIGSLLPSIISGAEIVAIVLSLQTTGPLLIAALQSQDMYLAGSFLMFLATLTVIGVLLSDIALGYLDPRIRLAGGANK